MDVKKDLIKVAKDLSFISKSIESSIRVGDYVVGIMGVNGGYIFKVTGKETELGKRVSLLESVDGSKKTDDLDYNLAPIDKNNWKSKILKAESKEWAKEKWG